MDPVDIVADAAQHPARSMIAFDQPFQYPLRLQIAAARLGDAVEEDEGAPGSS